MYKYFYIFQRSPVTEDQLTVDDDLLQHHISFASYGQLHRSPKHGQRKENTTQKIGSSLENYVFGMISNDDFMYQFELKKHVVKILN